MIRGTAGRPSIGREEEEEKGRARMRQEAGHPSQFTAWDFTVAWNQAWKPGNRLAEADSQSDFSLSQHRGSAFETKRNMRHINCLPVWPG